MCPFNPPPEMERPSGQNLPRAEGHQGELCVTLIQLMLKKKKQ